MKKLLISLLIVVVLFALGFFGASHFLFNDTEAPEEEQLPTEYVADENGTVSQVEEEANTAATYENGLATFTYDSSLLMFDEIPSDKEGGYPMSSFTLMDSEDILPRVDIYPLVLETPITDEETAKQDWETLVRSMLLGYYNAGEQEGVSITLTNHAVRIEDGVAKMFCNFSTSLANSATPNLSGSARMIADEDSAVLTLGIAKSGSSVPQAMVDLYMSAALH